MSFVVTPLSALRYRLLSHRIAVKCAYCYAATVGIKGWRLPSSDINCTLEGQELICRHSDLEQGGADWTLTRIELHRCIGLIVGAIESHEDI